MPNFKYETNSGTVVRIRLSAAKFAQAGTEPTAAVEEPNWFVSVSTSKRSQTKLKARGWVYKRSVAVVGETALKIFTIFLPKVTPTAYDATLPATIQYLGKDYTDGRRSAEE